MGACVARFAPPRTPCIPRMTVSSKSLDDSRGGSDSETMDAPAAGEHSNKKPFPAGGGASGGGLGGAPGGGGGGAGGGAGGGGPSKSTLSYPKRVGAPTLDLTLISPSSLERSPSTPSSSSSFAGLGSSRLLLQRRDSDMSIIDMMPSDAQVAWCQQALLALDEIFNSLRPKRGFDRDFQLLQQETDSKEFLTEAGGCTIGLHPGNARKNRYCDVIPFDNSRVKLSNSEVRMAGTSTGIQGTADYINANYVKLENSMEEGLPLYIATQGPLPSTVAHFWQMVKEQRCKAVIMLTKEIENNRIKCGRYFPLEEGDVNRCGHLVVTTKLKHSGHGAIERREIEIAAPESSDPPFVIEHYHYLDWPDHGVPMTTRPIRDLMRHLRLSQISGGPFLVHCSAGIGRTGAYCMIDLTIRRILKGNLAAINVRETVKKLRKQRAGMVQSKEQYFFCFMAIRDELTDLIEMDKRRRALDPGPPNSGTT